jgi:hypothetical protein
MVIASTGIFEGIKIFEAHWMPVGAGMALPGFGIIVYPGGSGNIKLLRHEFGHILQSKETGILSFYFEIGIPSLFSAMRNGKNGHRHQMYWTEVWADQLSTLYFKSME